MSNIATPRMLLLRCLFLMARIVDFQNSVKESPTVSATPHDSTDTHEKTTSNCDSADTSIDDMEPLCIDDAASKAVKNKVPSVTGIKDIETVDKGEQIFSVLRVLVSK